MPFRPAGPLHPHVCLHATHVDAASPIAPLFSPTHDHALSHAAALDWPRAAARLAGPLRRYEIHVAVMMTAVVKLLVNMDKDAGNDEMPPVVLGFVKEKPAAAVGKAAERLGFAAGPGSPAASGKPPAAAAAPAAPPLPALQLPPKGSMEEAVVD